MDHEPLPIMAPKLQDEIWYHGSITRQHAEALLKHVSFSKILKKNVGISIHFRSEYLLVVVLTAKFGNRKCGNDLIIRNFNFYFK